MSLYQELVKLAQRVESQLPQMQGNETATINAAVKPFLRALGYDPDDTREVYPEYGILNSDAVDLAVMRGKEPIFFVEAKKVNESLGHKWWKQLFEYFNADKAHIGILTNGREFKFYTDFDTANLMDKEPFLTLDLLNLDKSIAESLAAFSKSNFDPEKSLRNLKLRRLVEQELRQPSDDFVKHFAKQVHGGSMWKEVIAEYRPIVKKYLHEALGKGEDGDIDSRDGTIVKVGDDTPIDIEGKDDETLVFPNINIPLRKTYLRELSEAKLVHLDVTEDGFWKTQVRFDDETFTPSGAATAAARRIKPQSTNLDGWQFWRVIDPADGKERQIKDLRFDRDLLCRVTGVDTSG